MLQLEAPTTNNWLSKNLAFAYGSREITNEQISQALAQQGYPRTPEKIASVTGISHRFIAEPAVSVVDLADQAAGRLNVDLTPTKDLLFTTSYMQGRHLASEFAARHHLHPVFVGDFYRYCSGFVDALGYIYQEYGRIRRPVTIVSSEIYSRFIPNILAGVTDPALMQVIFGDGAAVFHFNYNEQLEVLSFAGKTYSAAESQAMSAPLDLNLKPNQGFISFLQPPRSPDQYLHMDGRAVYRFMSQNVPGIIEKALSRIKGRIKPPIDIVIPHQASKKVIQAIADRAPGLTDKFFYDIEDGNYSSASIPKAIQQANHQGLIQDGTTALLVGYGVGLRISAAVVRFH